MFMLTREILQIFRIGLNQFGFTLQNLHLKNRKREKKGLKKKVAGQHFGPGQVLAHDPSLHSRTGSEPLPLRADKRTPPAMSSLASPFFTKFSEEKTVAGKISSA
jgi:hypothetical protein